MDTSFPCHRILTSTYFTSVSGTGSYLIYLRRVWPCPLCSTVCSFYALADFSSESHTLQNYTPLPSEVGLGRRVPLSSLPLPSPLFILLSLPETSRTGLLLQNSNCTGVNSEGNTTLLGFGPIDLPTGTVHQDRYGATILGRRQISQMAAALTWGMSFNQRPKRKYRQEKKGRKGTGIDFVRPSIHPHTTYPSMIWGSFSLAGTLSPLSPGNLVL